MIFINLADAGGKVVRRIYRVLIEFCIKHINFYATFNCPQAYLPPVYEKDISSYFYIFFSEL